MTFIFIVLGCLTKRLKELDRFMGYEKSESYATNWAGRVSPKIYTVGGRCYGT